MKLRCHFKRAAYYGAIATWIFVVLCVIERPAYAYVDPGSGLFFLQVIGSTFVGFGFLVRKRIAQLFGLTGKGKKATQADVDAG
jgi:hypothetical protein